MTKFRKKPVQVEAWQFIYGFNRQEHPQWFSDARSRRIIRYGNDECFYIKTLEGEMRADYGDWIIRGIKGEIYPVKPDIFEATYEKVEP